MHTHTHTQTETQGVPSARASVCISRHPCVYVCGRVSVCKRKRKRERERSTRGLRGSIVMRHTQGGTGWQVFALEATSGVALVCVHTVCLLCKYVKFMKHAQNTQAQAASV